MKTLSGLRISHKISALMVGLIFGFIVIGITYYVQISVDKSIRSQEQTAQDFQNELTALRLSQAEMQVAANRYFSSGQARFADRYRELAQDINTRLVELTQHDSAHTIGDALPQIQGHIERHQTLFSQSAGDAGSIAGTGFDSRGELADAGNQLQSLLEDLSLTSTLPAFYALRQAETRVLSDEADAAVFDRQLDVFSQSLDALNVDSNALEPVTRLLERYREAVSGALASSASVDSLNTELETLEADIKTAFTGALAATREATETLRQQGTRQKQILDAVVTAIIFLVAMGTAVGIYLIYKSIVFPMVHMQSVIRKINRGKTNTRVKVLSHDELGDLGSAFNKLLDERIQQLEEQSKENERLNNSIISLIRALGMIAKKDLTVKVPVSADITGTISDAVNLLTKETAQTLRQVRDISTEVNGVSTQLDEQSSAVNQLAENERRQIMATSKALEVLARAMDQVAQRAETANGAAEQAIEHTQSARSTVLETVTGIRTIRETISETEKRVKRLGDRSQEISGIVNLINAIAERTHILALNASMHAASAGEAGKGFAVVADEVQRLAESARASTDEISAMVNSMRVDTSDTVNIMNTLITQVAEGSRLAEQAGQRMGDTEEATRQLVENVKVIAEHASQQAEVANRVKDRAAIIRGFSEKTGKQLEEQRKQTEGLKKCAATLVERVNVFVLPQDQDGDESRQEAWTGNVAPLPSPAAKAS